MIPNLNWTRNATNKKVQSRRNRMRRQPMLLPHIRKFFNPKDNFETFYSKLAEAPYCVGPSGCLYYSTPQKEADITVCNGYYILKNPTSMELEIGERLQHTMPAWKKWIEIEKLIDLNSTVDGDGSFEQVHENTINMNNYTIMNTLADGDCMYHAVLLAGMEAKLPWAEEVGDNPKSLRQILIDALDGTVPVGSPPIQEFINFVGEGMIPEMRQRITRGLGSGPMPPTAWGQSPELQLISFLYSVPITVVNQRSHRIMNFQPVEAGGIVLYWLGNHYEWLRPNTLIGAATIYEGEQPDLLNVPKVKSTKNEEHRFGTKDEEKEFEVKLSKKNVNVAAIKLTFIRFLNKNQGGDKLLFKEVDKRTDYEQTLFLYKIEVLNKTNWENQQKILLGVQNIAQVQQCFNQ